MRSVNPETLSGGIAPAGDIDLPAQSLRGDERVIAAIRRTRALARLMVLERRAFVEAVKRHPGVAEMVAREARETFRRALGDARARDAAAMAEAGHD